MKQEHGRLSEASRPKDKKLVITACVLVLCLILFGVSFFLEQEYRDEMSWVAAQGEVIERETESYYDPGLEIINWEYHYTVRYTKADGTTAQGQITTGTAEAEKGQTVDVIYDPNGDALAFGPVPDNTQIIVVNVVRYVMLGGAVACGIALFFLKKRAQHTKA